MNAQDVSSLPTARAITLAVLTLNAGDDETAIVLIDELARRWGVPIWITYGSNGWALSVQRTDLGHGTRRGDRIEFDGSTEETSPEVPQGVADDPAVDGGPLHS